MKKVWNTDTSTVGALDEVLNFHQKLGWTIFSVSPLPYQEGDREWWALIVMWK